LWREVIWKIELRNTRELGIPPDQNLGGKE